MSKLAEYRQLEKHLAEQLQAFEAMKEDDGLKKEIEFETKLRKLLPRPRGLANHASSRSTKIRIPAK